MGSILKSFKDLHDKGVDLMNFYHKRIGNGVSTSFWSDLWFGDSILETRFHRVFTLDNDKESNVHAKLNQGD